MSREGPTVVVIGAGVAGLAAARTLVRNGVAVTVLEQGDRVGGRLRTEMVDGIAVDVGAQFLINTGSRAVDMVREVGLVDQMTGISPSGAILRDGKLLRVWPDARMLWSRALSPWARLQFLGLIGRAFLHRRELDVHAPEEAYGLDTQSVTEFAHGRWSQEIMSYGIEPVLESFLYWSPSQTSVAMLWLLIRTLARTRRLYVMQQGLETLAERMAHGLDVRTDSQALIVERDDPHGRYAVTFRSRGRESTLTADGVIGATPASHVPSLFRGTVDSLPSLFVSVRYASCVTTAIAVGRTLPNRFFGVLFPRREAPRLAMAAVQSARGPGACPPGRDVILLYPSGPASRDLLSMGDAAVRAALVADLRLAGSTYDPGPDERDYRVIRWKQAIPMFDVGHLRRLHAFAHSGFGWDGVAFAGDYLGGPFVEGAITSGQRAATALLGRLRGPRGG
jgi:protoporphyrinogen/coproporphyrinogen III oxidase